MIDWGPALLMLAALDGAPASASAHDPLQFAQVVIREQIRVRVPLRLREVSPAPASPIEWKESRGPKCVPADSILGAGMLGQESVDLLLKDNVRVRARFEDRCEALDYYRGFYLTRNPDGMICADRDSIRSRVGGSCQIDKFRKLKPITRR